MADHARTQIRDLVAGLLDGLPTTEGRVFVGRTRNLGANHDPSLLVYARSEKIRRDAQGIPPPLERVLTIDIVGRVQMGDVPDNAIDKIATEVEAAMWAALDMGRMEFFGGKVIDLELKATDLAVKVESSDGGRSSEKHSGAVVLSYEVTYRTFEGAPTAFA